MAYLRQVCSLNLKKPGHKESFDPSPVLSHKKEQTLVR
jgi:hypothetical protein